jgi:hypothetical protein
MSKRLAKGSSKVCFYRDKRVASIHAAEQVIRADCPPACLSSKLRGFFEVVCCGRAAAQFQRSASLPWWKQLYSLSWRNSFALHDYRTLQESRSGPHLSTLSRSRPISSRGFAIRIKLGRLKLGTMLSIDGNRTSRISRCMDCQLE